MKISIITAVYNGVDFIEECINAVIAQRSVDLEYIVIDGGSTDGTLAIIEKYQHEIQYLVSEKDNGLYDAINKGIKIATGDVIGILNADDTFANSNVLSEVLKFFMKNPDLDAVYGDLNYVTALHGHIVRKWKSKDANWMDIGNGWMPAHPTLYLKKEIFEKVGFYALDLGTAADYDFILRIFYTYKINSRYLPILMVNMRLGGVSNQSFASRLAAFCNDYKSLKRNQVLNPILVLIKKKFSKLLQFF